MSQPDTVIERDVAPSAGTVDMKLEVVVIPVADVDRAKRFYGGLGWRLDADFAASDDWRVVQFTPPGSACSVIFGKNVTAAVPGSAQGLYLIVSDIKVARDELLRRGVGISEVFHAGDVHAGADEPYLFGRLRVSGPDPDHRSYRSYASFNDPDGNGWLLQEVTARLPGRVDMDDTTFTSSAGTSGFCRLIVISPTVSLRLRNTRRHLRWPDPLRRKWVRDSTLRSGRCPQRREHFRRILTLSE